MTLQLLHSGFPYIWGKFDFLFYQCTQHNLDYVWWFYPPFGKKWTIQECIVSMLRNTGWEHIYTFLLYPKIGLLLLADTAIYRSFWLAATACSYSLTRFRWWRGSSDQSRSSCIVSMLINTGWEHIYTFLLYPKIGKVGHLFRNFQGAQRAYRLFGGALQTQKS